MFTKCSENDQHFTGLLYRLLCWLAPSFSIHQNTSECNDDEVAISTSTFNNLLRSDT